MKLHRMHFTMLLLGMGLVSTLLFQNCAPVQFQPAEKVSEASTSGAEEPLLCSDGSVSGAVKWEVLAHDHFEEPGQCPYGGNLTLIYEKMQKVLCDGGQLVGQDEYKKGALITQRGGCDCADGVSNGSSIWKNVLGEVISENQACPVNGTLVLNYEKHQKYTCENGSLVSKQDFQKGPFINQTGACNCADGAPEGSSSTRLVPNATISEPGFCQYGGNLTHIYEKNQKFICQSSQYVGQNEYTKGKLIETTGACNCEGGAADGSIKYSSLAGQTISEPAVCKYGGTLVNIYEKLEKKVCTKAAFISTGEFSKGIFLRQEGSCNPPPVMTESFTVNSTKMVRPLDMVWVVDNSGSMKEEAAHVRNNLTTFINSLDKASDMKFLLYSQKGTTGTLVSLPSGLDAARFTQVNKVVGSTDGTKLVGDHLVLALKNGVPFFRTDSKKIVVFVTDDNSAISAATFMGLLDQAGARSADVAVFSFIGQGSASPCQAATGAVYQTLADQTKAKTYNICNLDWAQYFTDLKTDVLTKLGRSFKLQDTLAMKIVKVEVDGKVLLASDYSFAAGVLTLNDSVVLTETSSVKVSYTQE
ncbi:VWA domain-containing protein [Bdellovibrio sp. HCB337]|uniref:VWA domain-containing protein n=1 Tax=Bdellovibrio sp. HCB337 TaxID=3394358 RepID=UPI0039A4F201